MLLTISDYECLTLISQIVACFNAYLSRLVTWFFLSSPAFVNTVCGGLNAQRVPKTVHLVRSLYVYGGNRVKKVKYDGKPSRYVLL
jgi:hypothetical protein